MVLAIELLQKLVQSCIEELRCDFNVAKIALSCILSRAVNDDKWRASRISDYASRLHEALPTDFLS